MSQRGLLFVASKITKADLLSEDVYLHWYSDEHIPEVVDASGVEGAARYVDLDKKADRPYLALYPVADLAFLYSDEFSNLNSSSELLPGSGVIYDMADFDIRYYKRTESFESKNAKMGRGKCLLVAQVSVAEGKDEDYNAWYREEHLSLLAKIPGYLRCTRYELAVQRQNALGEEDTLAACPKFLALHEWDSTNVDFAELGKTMDTEWSKRVAGYMTTVVSPFYSLAKVFGNGDEKW